jgi:hypothetical protein
MNLLDSLEYSIYNGELFIRSLLQSLHCLLGIDHLLPLLVLGPAFWVPLYNTASSFLVLGAL